MKDSIKSSRVSRSPVTNLRQVKNLLPEDRPSRVDIKSKLSRSNAAHSKNRLAWYVALNSEPCEEKISRIPQIKWKCPPKFALNTGWHVAAGEGSQEAEDQKCRETTVPEIVYPDPTAIPPSPFTSPHMEDECFDNSRTPIIPIIPIEEVAAKMPFDTSATVNTGINPQPPASSPPVSGNLPLSQCNPSGPQNQPVHDKSLPDMLHGLESGDLEVAVAAAATVAAVMENKEQIDTELLIKFLTDPEIVKKLIDGNGLTAKPENGTPLAPEPNTSFPLPGSTSASVADKLANGCSEPLSRAIPSNPMPQAVNQSLVLPEPNTSFPLPSSTPASVADKLANGCSESLSRAIPFNSMPQAVNQSLVLPEPNTSFPLPSSTPASVADKLANGCSESLSTAIPFKSMPQAVNQSLVLPEPNTSFPLPSSTPASVADKLANGCSEPLSRAIPSNSMPQAVNQSLVLPEPNTSFPLPSSTPASVADKLANGCSEPLSTAIPSNSMPQAVNQSLVPACSKVETKINKSESKQSGIRTGSGPIRTSKPVKKSSLSSRSNSDVPPVKSLTSELGGPALSHIHQIARVKQVRPLMSSTLRPDEETIRRLINQYGAPNTADVIPVAPLNPSTSKPNMESIKKMIHAYGAPDAAGIKPVAPLIASTSRPPNMEEIKKMVNEYGVPDHGWGKRFMGPNPLLLASTPTPLGTTMVMPPMANLHALPNALESNFTATGNYHFPSFSPVTIPAPQVDFHYHKSLIKQHGEKHETEEHKLPKFGQPVNYLQGLESAHNTTSIKMNPEYQKPCIYFNSSKGCRNGYNCLYQHDVSKQWRASREVEVSVSKRMKFTERIGKV